MLHVMRLVPNDVLMFRAPRPFRGGIDTTAETFYLPTPNTIAGAIASVLYPHISNTTSDLKAEDVLKEFDVNLIAYGWGIREGQRSEMLFPFPLGVLVKHRRLGSLTLSCIDDCELSAEKDIIKRASQYLVRESSILDFDRNRIKDALRKSLTGEDCLENEVVSVQNILVTENRVGVMLNKKKTVEEGYLYSATYLRPKRGVYMWVIIRDDGDELKNHIKDGEQIKLGGRGRVVRVYLDNEYSIEECSEDFENYMYSLITYGCFKDSGRYVMRPHWAEKTSSVVASFTYISSWSILKNRPRFVGYYVSPGATYHVSSSKRPDSFVFYRVKSENGTFLVAKDSYSPLPQNAYLALLGGE